MRIVAGDLKGRVIQSPDEKTTRPTTDRVRESIFSSVYSRIPNLENVCVLDAFAGSGALGIEALSRGAKSCVFFEQDRAASRVLRDNLSSLGLGSPRAQLHVSDAYSGAADAGPYGLVLLDPPYAHEAKRIVEFLSHLATTGALEPSCVVVYEHAVQTEFEIDAPFKVTGVKKYGKIGVTYLKYDRRED